MVKIFIINFLFSKYIISLHYYYNNRIIINILRIINSNFATIYVKHIIVQLKNLNFIKYLIEKFNLLSYKFYINVILFFLSNYNIFFLNNYDILFVLIKNQIFEILLLIDFF